ncbi:diguanylate cyclase/phosphodiesterase with PAS/PAC and GAF sensor(s) [Alkaliphilus metalliredigens QYMF]|uniref:Diguanylate cyclase/phosphodiesterase with PAS/PAC and GAF sensor(S) n=1 Tax=Alkaliphilus metalliredigens (strain QYMF) TaxID=293826 RepID=A6TN79_ALKMQ|nr:EAL domain-containing protein [Alkaliphilus metalliredigens]ABR47647.1 diguanylate cyclase/phosphodiesterase with PAS/PAC and GAF sensor(s) [Alkaliphilus metalliredigens QYMF]
MNKSIINYGFNTDDLFGLLPFSLLIIKDGIIVDCNKVALEIFEYDCKEAIIGLKPYELSPEKQLDGSVSKIVEEEIVGSILKSKKQHSFQWTHKRKNGALFLADIRIFNKNGLLYALIVDISEIEELKRKLIGKDQIYRLLFENHNGTLLLIDPDTGKILEVNQSAIKYYGYTKEELLRMRIQDINVSNKKETTVEIEDDKGEERNRFQFTHRLVNDEEREVEVYSFPIETEYGNVLFTTIYDRADNIKQKLMFDTLFLDFPYGVVVLDENKKVRNVNSQYATLFQYRTEEIKGETISGFISPSQMDNQVEANIERVYKGQVIRCEGKRRRKDGKLIDVEIFCYPIINHQVIIGAYLIYIDISKNKDYEKELRLFGKILENNTEGVIITNEQGIIEWVNCAFSEITGYSFAEIKGHNYNVFHSGIHSDIFYEDMWKQIKDKGSWSGEIWSKNKQGHIFPGWLTINSISNDENHTTHYVSIFKDLSDKKRIDNRMSELQEKDTLTGLYNRNYFLQKTDEYVEKYKDSGGKFSVVYIDVKGFKEINDSLGHFLGDRLLIEISKRLLHLMDESYILSRFCGDEFVILCKPSILEKEVIQFSKNIFKDIKRSFNIKNTLLHVSVNMGISRFPEDGTDAETLIRCADIAMYKAKEKLLDEPCLYEHEMAQKIEEKFLLANHLVEAIVNNELTIHFQPIFEIDNQSVVVGAEALLRWENPVLGMVSPMKFIPIAEQTGQIILVGKWVLEQVCRQIKQWKEKGLRIVPISVNISARQLEQAGFTQMLIDIMKKHNIESSLIELEITESISLGEFPVIIKNLKQITQYGVKISMDDFGTGYSSLGQLGLLQLDKLKIDKIFIDEITKGHKKRNLVEAIIAMANSLDLVVVAEGIETVEQLLYLQEMGCQLGQGYLFSKPVDSSSFERFLSANS